MAVARNRNPRGEGDRLRTTLLDSASDLLAEVGDVDKLSVRAVTARAGVSPNALYLHYADRDELVADVVRRAFAELRAYTAAAEREHEGDPWAQLRGGCRAYMRFALDRPGHYRVLFATYRPRLDDPDGGGFPRFELGRDAFEDLVRCTARCLPPDRDPFEAAMLLWTGMHGRVSLEPVMSGFPFGLTLEEHVDALIAAHVGAPAD